MRAITWAVSALGLVYLSAAPAQAAAFVLGDSLGLGVSRAGHLKNLSKISIHIRGKQDAGADRQTPDGSTVFLVLGTNDAEGSIARLDKHIDDIVEAMERKNITLVWLGPPCVRKAWDTRALELDNMLQEPVCEHRGALRQHARRRDVFGRLPRARRRSPEDEGLRLYVGEGAHGNGLCGRRRGRRARGCPDRFDQGERTAIKTASVGREPEDRACQSSIEKGRANPASGTAEAVPP